MTTYSKEAKPHVYIIMLSDAVNEESWIDSAHTSMSAATKRLREIEVDYPGIGQIFDVNLDTVIENPYLDWHRHSLRLIRK